MCLNIITLKDGSSRMIYTHSPWPSLQCYYISVYNFSSHLAYNVIRLFIMYM